MNTRIDTAKIERAMDALLHAILDDEGRRPAPAAVDLSHVATAAEIEEGDVISADMDAIIADPIGVACRSELAALGSLLFETVGTSDDMGDVMDRVAGMQGANAERRREIIEEAWEHVGPEGDGNWD
jgi:hypothetical protein